MTGCCVMYTPPVIAPVYKSSLVHDDLPENPFPMIKAARLCTFLLFQVFDGSLMQVYCRSEAILNSSRLGPTAKECTL